MATTKWSNPPTEGANIASTALDGLASGAESAGIAYDNSTALDLYAFVRVLLGSLAPVGTPTITLKAYCSAGGVAEDISGGGEPYAIAVSTSTSAKNAIFKVRLLPCPMRFTLSNGSGVALASTGNELHVTPYSEQM